MHLNREAFVSSQLAPSPTPPPHCDIYASFLQNTATVPPCAVTYSSQEESYYSYIGGSSQYLNQPSCTAAAITGSLCESVRDNYQLQENAIFYPEIAEEAFFFNQGKRLSARYLQ